MKGNGIDEGRVLTTDMNMFEVRKENRPRSIQTLARELRNKGVQAAKTGEKKEEKISSPYLILQIYHFTNARRQTYTWDVSLSGDHGSVTPM